MNKLPLSNLAISRKDVGIRRNKYLSFFFDTPITTDWQNRSNSTTTRIGWGRKESGNRAVQIAKMKGSPFCLLEDGFLRSVSLGHIDPPLSIVLDDKGIYYDARTPSRIEELIQCSLTQKQKDRTRSLIQQWKQARVSKYNHLPEYDEKLPENFVLLVDQTFGDSSISYGLASAESFQNMLDTALSNHKDSIIIIKTHPDVFAGRKKGHFDLELLKTNPRIFVLAEDVHPVRLIEEAQAVYVVTSQMGFEGLLWGKPVYTFGMPFYAGYGLTTDAVTAPKRRSTVLLEQLVYAALIEYPRYLNPETQKLSNPEFLIEWMSLQRQVRNRFPKQAYALGFSRWKKPILKDFFQMTEISFIRKLKHFPNNCNLIVWGMRQIGKDIQTNKLLRVEDGFLRSVGLGADLVRPLSWVIDTRGIYYNATSPSDLEVILKETDFDALLRNRAKSLREKIVASNLTKYNVGTKLWQRPNDAKKVILVPGQVESDASIQYGSRVIRKNMQLLQEVRKANPEAYIIYKPHPDVVAGLRKKSDNEDHALKWCDELLTEHSIGSLFTLVDEVHVLTSLAGFEALMRGCTVITYGQPFYSGWGLTNDIYPPERRGRTLSLDELVAATLILYPVYLNRVSGKFTTPETTLDELLKLKEQKIPEFPKWRKMIRPLLAKISASRRKRE